MSTQEPTFVDAVFSSYVLGTAGLLAVAFCLLFHRTRRAIERSFDAPDRAPLVPPAGWAFRPAAFQRVGPGPALQRVPADDARLESRFDVVEEDDTAPSTGLEDDLDSHLVVRVRVH